MVLSDKKRSELCPKNFVHQKIGLLSYFSHSLCSCQKQLGINKLHVRCWILMLPFQTVVYFELGMAA